MFKSEQLFSRNIYKRGKFPVYPAGIALDQDRIVKINVTHREFSLVVGIVVAIIVIFTLWLKQTPEGVEEPASTGVNTAPSSALSITKKASVLAEKLTPMLKIIPL